MKLESLILREIRLDLVEPFRISSGTVQARRIVLVEARDAGGASGWGECVAGEEPAYSYETADTAWLALGRWLGPRILAAPETRPEEVRALLDDGVRGHLMAKAALEMALWSLDAELLGVSLARRIGGERRRIEVGVSLGIQPTTADLVARAQAALALGYLRIKLKIAPGLDLERVRAVREALGDAVALSVDANCAYGDDPASLDLLQALDGLGLAMIEQPFPPDHVLALADLQRRLRTPICLDESVTGPRQAAELLALDAGRVINVKPGRVGGFRDALAIHAIARERGAPLWCGGMLESGIGRSHNVALASLPGFVWPGDLSPSRRYWAEDVVEPEWEMSPEGMVEVPLDRPGPRVRRDRIEALTAREETLRAPTR